MCSIVIKCACITLSAVRIDIDSAVLIDILCPCIIGAKPVYWSAYGKGSHPISLAGLACNGEESNLLKCNRDYYSLLSCHGQVAGAQCESKARTHTETILVTNLIVGLCDDLSVRIIGTPYSNMGRVDLCKNRVWHRICSLPHEVASIVCRQLGYSIHGKNCNIVSIFS